MHEHFAVLPSAPHVALRGLDVPLQVSLIELPSYTPRTNTPRTLPMIGPAAAAVEASTSAAAAMMTLFISVPPLGLLAGWMTRAPDGRGVSRCSPSRSP